MKILTAISVSIVLLLMNSNIASAQEYQSRIKIFRYFTNSGGTVLLGTVPKGTNTCDYYDLQYRFDGKTSEGKNMLAILMVAHSTGKLIDLWYDASTAIGTDQTTGCTYNTMAVISAVGISANQ